MDWLELSVKVGINDLETASDIANMTVPYGIYIEDYSDLEDGAREIAHIDLIDEELVKKDRSTATVHIYFANDDNLVEAAAYLTEQLSAANIKYEICRDTVSEKAWAENWKQFFKCTEIGERLVICPSWEKYDSKMGKSVLMIDPGAAFGTGTHATTRMCLSALQDHVNGGETVLDIGCGSGIIGIAAALLGAESVVGVDIDETAVKVSNENAEINKVSEKCRFLKGDLVDKVSGKYNVVCANIVADAIISLSAVVGDYMAENGVFICSGIIDIRRDEVFSALKNNGFKNIKRIDIDNWSAFTATK